MGAFIRRGIAIALLGGASLVASSPVRAAGVEIHVVPPGGSVQRAVDLAKPGDIVQLGSGTYAGGILVTKSHLTIRGTGNDTIVVPSGNSDCAASIGESGICVIGAVGQPVAGVNVEDLAVRGFAGFGVVGFFTDQLRVARVVAADNTEYGITEFASTRGSFVDNWVTGAASEAGLYVGDIDDAKGTVVSGNYASSNQIGLLLRHARNVTITGNTFTHNCAGLVLVDDGQPGGAGNTIVTRNVVKDNNSVCPAHEEVPALQGTGIALIGGDHDLIEANVVTGNQGSLEYSGGIGLFPGIPPGGAMSGLPASYHKIVSNLVAQNDPANLVDQSGANTNSFVRNRFLVPTAAQTPPIVGPPQQSDLGGSGAVTAVSGQRGVGVGNAVNRRSGKSTAAKSHKHPGTPAQAGHRRSAHRTSASGSSAGGRSSAAKPRATSADGGSAGKLVPGPFGPRVGQPVVERGADLVGGESGLAKPGTHAEGLARTGE